jgi:hypothetical protein
MTLLYKNDGFLPLESIPDNYKMKKGGGTLNLDLEISTVDK